MNDQKAIDWFCIKTRIKPPPRREPEAQDAPQRPTPKPRIFSPYSTTEAPADHDIFTDSKYEG